MTIIMGQYNGDNYQLTRFYENEIPGYIFKAILQLVKNENVIIRGGLSYVLLFERENYILKDIDLLALNGNVDKLVTYFYSADIVYINKNTHGECVITAFWKNQDTYYKVDILMNSQIEGEETCFWRGNKCKTITKSFLWMDRMRKIAERKQRHHPKEKTLNHYLVAKYICEYMLSTKYLLNPEHSKFISSKIKEVKNSLVDLVEGKELNAFLRLNDFIINKSLGN